MTNKYKISELAKDFGLTSKDIIKIIAEKTGADKKSSTALDEKEISLVFDTLTKQNEVKSFADYFATGAESRAAAKKAREEEKNKKLLANRAARAEFKYEYEKDKDGKSTGKIINADVLVQNHKDFEKITEEMAELSKEQESCTKYLEEFRQMDNKKMEEFAKVWNEAARDSEKTEKQENSKPEPSNSEPSNPTPSNQAPSNSAPNNPTPSNQAPSDSTPSNQTTNNPTSDKQKIKIVIGRRLNIKTDKYIIGIGKTGKLVKQDREDISAKLQKILKGKSIEELKESEEIAETIDPILLEGIIELKNKNMITEIQMNKTLLKLASNDVKKEDLNFEIVYDMKDLSKGAFLPWNRKTRDQIAKIAEENREKGIAEFKDGKEYEPNPIKRMLESVKQKRLGKGEEREIIDAEFKEIKDENAKKKSRFTNPFKNRIKEDAKTKSVYEQLRDDSFKGENLDEVIKRAKEAAINGKITKTQLVGIINNAKATKEREESVQNELGENVSEIMEEESK